MEWKEILSHVDHTLLKPEATWDQVKKILEEAIEYGCASACIPAAYGKQAVEFAAGRLPICTVIGFPNGYSTTAAKCFEAAAAVADGVEEIDMVINLGWVKDGLYSQVLEEIRRVKDACAGRVLKVIIETCLLTEEEKIRMCQVVGESGADFIKTSTGFSAGGATAEDVALLRRYSPPQVKVKAAGGISSKEDAQTFLALGAHRLGTSRLVGLARQERGE